MTQHWEHFEHEADIGVRGYGNTVAQAFEQAALAMSSVIADIDDIKQQQCLDVECEAPDLDILLVDWLNEVVYQMATRKMLFASFEVTITGYYLQATICGETVDPDKHQPVVEVKGATFTELKVYKNPDQSWVAQCVVDV